MPAHDATIRDIDAKLAQAKELYDKAAHWSRLLGTIDNNIKVLERAKAILLRDEMPAEPGATIPVWDDETSPYAQKPVKAATPNFEESSIGALMVAILREAGSALPVQTILERLHSSKGRSDVSLKTLSGVLSQYLAKKAIRRVARATYALPDR